MSFVFSRTRYWNRDSVATDSARFVRWLPGSSGAFLAQDSDKQNWVIKRLHNGQGRALLSNEVTGAILLRYVGLPSLPWRRLHIDDTGADGLPFRDHEELRSRNKGIPHFASRYLGEPEYTTCQLSVRPEQRNLTHLILGIYVFDLWAAHVDCREILLALDRRTQRTGLFAIDNGHLFYGPEVRSMDWQVHRLRLTATMNAVITQPGAHAVIMQWVEALQCILPKAIDQLCRDNPPWGLNSLLLDPRHFLDRLARLQTIIETDLQSRQ